MTAYAEYPGTVKRVSPDEMLMMRPPQNDMRGKRLSQKETCSARAAIADAGPPRSPHACPYLTQAPTDMMRLVQNGTGRWRSKRSTNAACSRAGPNK